MRRLHWGVRLEDCSKLRRVNVGLNKVAIMKDRHTFVSPWHDIQLPKLDTSDIYLPFVCEIPMGTSAKMEVNLKEKFNTITQDVENGEPRLLPIKTRFNYGMLPQTYESPQRPCHVSGFFGDGDPVDMVDISSSSSSSTADVGSVFAVKLLGSFCFIDGQRADWKVIVSRNFSDSPTGSLEEIFSFFENYKGPDSGNYIFDNRKLFSPEETLQVIREAHESYKQLFRYVNPPIWLGPF